LARATATTTGVKSTAVVSNDRNAVTTAANATTMSHSTITRPREARQACCGGVEHTGARRELRDDRHGHDEQQDRPHAVADLQRRVHRQNSEHDGCAAQSSSTAPITASNTASIMDPPRPVPGGDRLHMELSRITAFATGARTPGVRTIWA
jgi:hypothetical protein